MSCQCFPSLPLSVGLKPFGGEIFEVKNKQPGHYWILFRRAWIEKALKTRRKATLRLLCLLMFTASCCLSCPCYLELIAFSKSVCSFWCARENTCVCLIVSVHIFSRLFTILAAFFFFFSYMHRICFYVLECVCCLFFLSTLHIAFVMKPDHI